jgi:glutathione S-transferase
MVFARASGLSLHEVVIKLGKLEQKTDAFQQVNRLGKVPVLVEADGYTLSESCGALCGGLHSTAG